VHRIDGEWHENRENLTREVFGEARLVVVGQRIPGHHTDTGFGEVGLYGLPPDASVPQLQLVSLF
jgi:hypothetical protein